MTKQRHAPVLSVSCCAVCCQSYRYKTHFNVITKIYAAAAAAAAAIIILSAQNVCIFSVPVPKHDVTRVLRRKTDIVLDEYKHVSQGKKVFYLFRL